MILSCFSDEVGNTPATIAATRGHVKILKVLHNAGVDLSVPDGRGNTAATLAACKGHVSVLTFLAECKVDLSAKDACGSC